MAFAINTNIASLDAQNYLETSTNFQNQTIGEVSSGLRIVNSGDDAAGLAVANGLASDQAVLNQGILNVANGEATLQTIDGGMSNISTLLDRAQTLATESASGTFTGDRSTLNSEFQSVLTEINRQAQSIGMNQGGQFAQALSVYVGGGRGSTAAAASANGSIGIDLSQAAVSTQNLGLSGAQVTAASGTNLNVQSILADPTNRSESTQGETEFSFQGAGFSGANAIKINVNLAGVNSMSTLVSAVNAALQSAGQGTTAAEVAFKNANVTASVYTDADGNQSLAFNSNSAFQVNGLDRMANALMGNYDDKARVSGAVTPADPNVPGVIDTSTANTINIEFNGATSPTTFSLGSSAIGKTVTAQEIADDLNSQSAFSALGTAYVDSSGKFIIESNSTASNSEVKITDSSGSNLATALGIASADATIPGTTVTGQSVQTTVTGQNVITSGTTPTDANGNNIVVRFQGSGLASPVDIVLTPSSTEDTGQELATALQSAVADNAQLQGAGITMTSATAGSAAVFTGTGNQGFTVQVAGDTNNLLGMGTAALADPTTATSLDYQSITAGAAVTAGTATLEFSAGGGPSFSLGSITLTGNATTDEATISAAMVAADAKSVADGGKANFADGGLVATESGGVLTFKSNNGTNFLINEDDATNFAGFNSGGIAISGAGPVYSSAIAPESNTYVSGGDQATQTVAFSNINFGGDEQTIGLSATDANGVQHTATIVLGNNATLTNGGSIDAAVNAINSQLQASNDPTLEGLVAFKQTVNGQDVIGFAGASAFQVTSGTTTSGAGVGSQGTSLASTLTSGGANLDISTASDAQTAINALTNAVAIFGTAQAAVGRGENDLNYATNLAQSEATNDAAAESNIKDANLAEEAANLTKAQILTQAGVAALAQANSAPQGLLKLLGS